MKTLQTYLLAAVFLLSLTLIISCTQTEGPAAQEETSVVEGGSLYKGGPSANGQAALIINDDLQTFAFHAREKSDGSVTGSLEGKSRGQDFEYHGDVDCLVITDGTTAVIGGVVTQARNGPDAQFEINVGERFWFKVRDNGEGANSPAPDEFTDVIVNIGDNNFGCPDDPFGLAFLSIVNGNIQVKP
jgi:hypothetical protein